MSAELLGETLCHTVDVREAECYKQLLSVWWMHS